MRIETQYICTVAFQELLDKTFGQNIFSIIVEKFPTRKYFVEFDDLTPTDKINEMLSLVEQSVSGDLSEIKVRSYTKLKQVIEEMISSKEKKYNDEDYQSANTWIQNTNQVPPVVISYTALIDGKTNEQVANEIINEKIYFDQITVDSDSIFSNCLSFVASSNNIISIRERLTTDVEQIRNL